MPKKSLQVQVEVDVQAVTCPGVWLCPNGKVSLQVFMLDSCIQTTCLRPIFPLLYHERFVFYKTFHSARSLGDLQRLINNEHLYAELIQWQNCESGNVLASFQTSLADVLYPTTYEGAVSGVDIDLLMDPSKNFPGIIAPKIEISTRTTIEEIIDTNRRNKKSNAYVVNPKVVTSDQSPCVPKRNQARQQKVCHSLGYHKSRRCTRSMKRSSRPPFAFRKADEELLARRPQGLGDCSCIGRCKCWPRSQSSSPEKNYAKLTENFVRRCPKLARSKMRDSQRSRPANKTKMCSCGSGHVQENCPLCTMYGQYFEGGPSSCSFPVPAKCKHSPLRDSYVRKVTTSSPTRETCTRSPVRTLGKEYGRPETLLVRAKPYVFRSCSQTALDSPQELRNCDCLVALKENRGVRKKCCPARKKPSLAEQIHRRLLQTLDCAPSYSLTNFERRRELYGSGGTESPAGCGCPSVRDCSEGLYKNLGKFYRSLHRC